MPNDERAAVEAAVARYERPTPRFVQLGSVTKALTELRGKLAAAIRAHATTLGRPADSAVKQIDEMLDEVSRELLYCHQYSGLDLYLDIDGTDTGLRRIPPGELDEKAINRGWASTDHETGSILGPLSDLAEFAQKFLADRGYSAIEATSIIRNSHPRGDAASGAPLDNAATKPADTSSGDQRTAEKAEPEKPAVRRGRPPHERKRLEAEVRAAIREGKYTLEQMQPGGSSISQDAFALEFKTDRKTFSTVIKSLPR